MDMKTKMFFLSGIDNLRDPARNTRWRLIIPSGIFAATGIKATNGLDFGSGEDGTNDFALHVESCPIPGIQIKEDYLEYMGFKSAFPVNAEISADLKFTTKLMEDMRAYEAMLGWQQSLLNTGVLVDDAGNDRMSSSDKGVALGMGNHKDIKNSTHDVLRNNSIRVELYNWMLGRSIFKLNLINAFPKDVSGFELSYAESAKLLKFDFTLHCDRWTVHVPPDYSTRS